MKKFLGLVVLIAIFLALGATFSFAMAQEKENEFIIFHYWTAGGEKEAIDALFKIYQERNPGVKIVENPVAGGGGETMLAVLMSNLAAGIPPDSFQDHQGNQQKDYIDAGYLEAVDDIWAETNFEARINPMWVKTLKFDGHVYSVPINAHRTNWLWYNKKNPGRSRSKTTRKLRRAFRSLQKNKGSQTRCVPSCPGYSRKSMVYLSIRHGLTYHWWTRFLRKS